MKVRDLYEIISRIQYLTSEVLEARISLEHGGHPSTIEYKRKVLKDAENELGEYLDTEIGEVK